MPVGDAGARVGGQIVYGTPQQAFITGQVVEYSPNRRIVHTFQFHAGTPANVATDAPSRVTYQIEPMGKMCRLTLTHDGFDADNQTYANVTGGWPTILSGLKTWVETGEAPTVATTVERCEFCCGGTSMVPRSRKRSLAASRNWIRLDSRLVPGARFYRQHSVIMAAVARRFSPSRSIEPSSWIVTFFCSPLNL